MRFFELREMGWIDDNCFDALLLIEKRDEMSIEIRKPRI